MRLRGLLLALGCSLALTASWAEEPRAAAASRPEDSAAADRLIDEIGRLLVTVGVPAAQEHAEQALDRFERHRERRAEAYALAFLGLQYAVGGRSERAVASLERSLGLLVDLDDPFPAAAVARLLGSFHADRDDLGRAEAVFRQALDQLDSFSRSGRAIPDAAYWLFAPMLGLPSDLSKLDDPFSPATRNRLAVSAEATLRDGLGEVLLLAGRPGEAESELERSERAARSIESRELWRVLSHLGHLRRAQGRLEEARASWEGVLAELDGGRTTLSPGEIRRERIGHLDAIARLERRRNRDARSREPAANGGGSAPAAGDPLGRAFQLLSRAEELAAGGDSAAAEEVLRAASTAAGELGDPYLEATVFNRQGSRLLAWGRYEAAAAALERAVARYRDAGEGRPEILVRAKLAIAYLQLGDADRAARVVREAAELAESADFPTGGLLALMLESSAGGEGSGARAVALRRLLGDPRISSSLQPTVRDTAEAVHLLLQDAEPERIERAAGRALDRALAAGAPAEEARARLLLGHARRLQGDSAGAREQWQASAAIHRRLGLHHEEATALTALADLARRDGRREEAAELATAAVEAIERTAATVRVDELLVPFLARSAPVYLRAVAALAELGRTDEAFEYGERARARALVRLLEGAGTAAAAAPSRRIPRSDA